MRRFFRFPNPINEVAARLTAGGVVLLTIGVFLGQTWLIAVLAYGFVARVVAGPKLSPMSQLAGKVVIPALHLKPKPTPGPPKRFAQGIGAVLSVGAAIACFTFGNTTVALVLVAMITIAATLESVFALCLGCMIFSGLIRVGVIPERVCEECANIWNRIPDPAKQDEAVTA